jgi:hypothetical protein
MAVQLFAIINVKNSLPGTHQSKIAAAKEPEKEQRKRVYRQSQFSYKPAIG